MPKGYLVANIRVKDKEKFAAFSGMAAPVIKAHGGKVLANFSLSCTRMLATKYPFGIVLFLFFIFKNYIYLEK